MVRAKYIHCTKIFSAKTRKHGTSSLMNHIFTCMKNPHDKSTRQKLLIFSKNESALSVGVIGT